MYMQQLGTETLIFKMYLGSRMKKNQTFRLVFEGDVLFDEIQTAAIDIYEYFRLPMKDTSKVTLVLSFKIFTLVQLLEKCTDLVKILHTPTT